MGGRTTPVFSENTTQPGFRGADSGGPVTPAGNFSAFKGGAAARAARFSSIQEQCIPC